VTAKYKVLAPYVTFRIKDPVSGSDVLLGWYAGAPVPPNANAEDVERLARKGYIVEVDSFAGEHVAVPAGTPVPGEPPNVPVTEQPASAASIADRVDRAQAAVDAASAGGKPRGNASRADWAAYAGSQGAPEDETKPVEEGGLSQSDLRAKYGN
jgi:hypothetical protein